MKVKPSSSTHVTLLDSRSGAYQAPLFTSHEMIEVEDLRFIADRKNLQVAENIEMSNSTVRANTDLSAQNARNPNLVPTHSSRFPSGFTARKYYKRFGACDIKPLGCFALAAAPRSLQVFQSCVRCMEPAHAVDTTARRS
jgi:hypothetical protein